jgi:hypothetical protein
MESSFRKGPAGEAATRKVATRDVAPASIEMAAAATEVTAAAARSATTPAMGKG